MFRLIMLNKSVEPLPGQSLGISVSAADLKELREGLEEINPNPNNPRAGIRALAALLKTIKGEE